MHSISPQTIFLVKFLHPLDSAWVWKPYTNFFHGNIPSSLASLKGIVNLDLSQNNLLRPIPKEIQNLHFLVYLNLSYNNMVGEVPIGEVFQNASATFFIGNSKLCGGVSYLHLPSCPKERAKPRKSYVLKLAIKIVCVIVSLIILLLLCFVLYRRR